MVITLMLHGVFRDHDNIINAAAAAKSLSCVRLLATPWTAAHQAPPSMGFSRQEYWSALPLPSPGNIIAHYFLKSW